MLFLYCLIVSIAIGWWLVSVEFFAGFASLFSARILKDYKIKTLLLLSFFIGIVLITCNIEFAPIYYYTPGVSLIIVVCSSIAILLLTKFDRYSSINYALLGAMFCWDFFYTGVFNLSSLRLVVSWLVAPLMVFVVTVSLMKCYRLIMRYFSPHLIVFMRWLSVLSTISLVLLALSIGINSSSIFSSFSAIDGMQESQYVILFIVAVILSVIVAFGQFDVDLKSNGENYDYGFETPIILSLSVSLVLLFFSFKDISGFFGLLSSPLSVSHLTIASLSGILFTKHIPIDFNGYSKSLISFFITPLLAFVLTYIALLCFDENGFPLELNVEIGRINLPVLVLSVLFLFGIIIVLLYIKRINKNRHSVQQQAIETQKSLFENQIAMSELQVKSVIVENEALTQKMELRRGEMINIALSIYERREFLQLLHKNIKSIYLIENMNDKMRKIAEIENILVQKMTFSQEMDHFYAEVELLHKDFNIRLMEKFPKLTEHERRLAILLRLGFSSKYIASLMNILPKSVEISRYRLRIKMGLEADQRLSTFIKSL